MSVVLGMMCVRLNRVGGGGGGGSTLTAQVPHEQKESLQGLLSFSLVFFELSANASGKRREREKKNLTRHQQRVETNGVCTERSVCEQREREEASDSLIYFRENIPIDGTKMPPASPKRTAYPPPIDHPLFFFSLSESEKSNKTGQNAMIRLIRLLNQEREREKKRLVFVF